MNSLTDVDWSQIPAPTDDGATAHLSGMSVPSVSLMATQGDAVDLSLLTGITVLYAYPMTGQPGVALPDGWDMIPGARGCTPQSCAFRDHAAELRALGVEQLLGVSTQSVDYQREAAERLHLPFALLSDARLELATALQLPTFDADGQTLIKRLTLILVDNRIRHVIYPVFPPDTNAAQVIDWLTSNDASGRTTGG